MIIIIRPATFEDWKMVLDLRNQDYVRKVSWNQDIINEDEHKKFFKDNYKYYYIINKNCGFIRVKDNEISIALYKEFWNKGLGAKALKIICREFDGMKATIRINNPPSLACFKNAGFKIVGYLLEKKK